jgi:hypothetical protein
MKYKGSKDTESTKQLVSERVKYKLDPFRDISNVIDYNFSDRVYYGRINKNYNSMYVNEETLSGINNSMNPHSAPRCVNFVADALHAFLRKMDQAKLMGRIDSDSFFNNLRVHKAYENPQELYVSFVNEYLSSFNNLVNKEKINNFKDWMAGLIDWNTKNGSNFPLTFSGFQKSKRSNIFTSGMAISFSSESADDDSMKEKMFLNDKQLEFYLSAAKQYGFNVHQNAPWIIVADINSPAMSLYTKKYDLSTENEIFLNNFSLCYERDIDLLKKLLQHNWKLYISKNKKITLLDTKCNKTKVSNIYINNNININNIYYIINYINIRNTEEYGRYSKPELDRIIKKAIFFEKKLDKSKSISYINEQFRVLSVKRPGTLNDKINITRRKNDISDN